MSLFAIGISLFAITPLCKAQSLGWEGETGVFVTPLAYTAASGDGIGKPVVAFHFMSGGPVLGDFYTSSITFGFAKRFEFGYTRELHSLGQDAAFSPLWHDGFNVVHAKVNLVSENLLKKRWIPAISAGFMARTQVHNVGGAIANKDITVTYIWSLPRRSLWAGPLSSAADIGAPTQNSGD